MIVGKCWEILKILESSPMFEFGAVIIQMVSRSVFCVELPQVLIGVMNK